MSHEDDAMYYSVERNKDGEMLFLQPMNYFIIKKEEEESICFDYTL